ncbi:hypothetical protein SK128_012687 [Halocaridina rubra]|uniref:Sushi domain-containing protein n=1 Tax=Halocaridina rubra TaxID=373956 RepID=A0AAN9AA09_HALRR
MSTVNTSGSFQCIEGADGEENYWSSNFSFPCRLYCKEPFINSNTETHCLNFTNVPEEFGVYGAAFTCAAMGSSLAVLESASELSQVPDSDSYFTSHIRNSNDQLVISPGDSNITCGGSCMPTSNEGCLTVSIDSSAMSDCTNSSMKALCRFPPICPSGYEEFRGLCYKLFCDSSYDFRKYLSKCNDEGSALFYPQSIEELEFVRTLLPNYGTAQGPTTQLAIGLNDVNGSWTGGGLYAPDSNITGMANTSDDSENWRIVNFTSTTMTPSRISSKADCTVCQYLARSGCWEPPPSPMGNMALLDNNFTMDFDSEVVYECYLGHFFEGDITLPSKSLTCIGQLGNWYADPPLSDCRPANVCLETLPPDDGYNVTITPESRFYNGTIDYACPPGQATEEGFVVQTLLCSYDNGSYSFLATDIAPCHGNISRYAQV